MGLLADILARFPFRIEWVTLHGMRFILGSCDNQASGFIATLEAYENGREAYAQLMPDGRVLRFGLQIATRHDIHFTGEILQ